MVTGDSSFVLEIYLMVTTVLQAQCQGEYTTINNARYHRHNSVEIGKKLWQIACNSSKFITTNIFIVWYVHVQGVPGIYIIDITFVNQLLTMSDIVVYT